MRLFILPFSLLSCGLALSLPCAFGASASDSLSSPALSPDGKQLAFVRQTPLGSRVFVGNWNGKTVLRARVLSLFRLSARRGNDIQPAWRPDGQLLAFASNRGTSKRFDLYCVRPDGTGLKPLTQTPTVDETEPQWLPKRFTLREGDGSPLVPDRSRAAISGSELRLIQKLAGRADALDEYSKNSYRPTFDTKVSARFYKLLASTSSGKGDSGLITLRDDGSHRRTLNAGMPGSYSSPRFDPTGRGMAFLRRNLGSGGLYFAQFPIESELLDDKGNSKGLQLDSTAWRKTIRRVRDASPEAQLAFSPNGEQLALASKGLVNFVARPDTNVSQDSSAAAGLNWTWLSVARGKTGLAPVGNTGLFFSPDGQSVYLSARQGTFVSFHNRGSLADVSNLLAFSETSAEGDGLRAADRALLARNSFVVGGQGAKQMFAVYEETDYRDLPVFVSSDSLLHLNHLVFDSLLRETETKNLLPATIELATHYLRASIGQSRSAPALRADALANVAYWSVVARLLRGEVSTGLQDPPSSADAGEAKKLNANRAKNIAAMNALTASLAPLLGAVPPEAKALADAEIALIRAHAGRASSPTLGGQLVGVGRPDVLLVDTRIDYTGFSPRGHYTRTEALRRFFLASRWLSGAPFRTSSSHLRRALLMASATDAASGRRLQTLSRVMSQFVGESDDRRFLDVVSIARGVYGPSVPLASIGNSDQLKEFGEQVDKLPRPRIAPSGGPAMTLFPAPYTLDSQVMQNLVYDRQAPDVGTEEKPRYFALGLDVMGVLGSNRARGLLDSFTFGDGFFDFGFKESGYANYQSQFNRERQKLAALPASEWTRSFYAQTLWSLRPLLATQSNPRFKFTQNAAWTDKQLNAALGAWAELKHDAMPKQPVAIEAGGEGGLTEVELEEQPQGFVEPSPATFARLRELVSSERVALAQAGFLSKESNDRLSAFGALLDMVIRLEAKQRAGYPFTPGEVEQLRFFGTFLEHITLTSLEGQSQTMEDNDMAIIADVSSALSTRTNELRALEEGVGHALPIYVAFERNGRRQLARGAAYSYYEFTHPASDRLTDAAWQELLGTKEAPKIPAWTKSFVSRVSDGS